MTKIKITYMKDGIEYGNRFYGETAQAKREKWKSNKGIKMTDINITTESLKPVKLDECRKGHSQIIAAMSQRGIAMTKILIFSSDPEACCFVEWLNKNGIEACETNSEPDAEKSQHDYNMCSLWDSYCNQETL